LSPYLHGYQPDLILIDGRFRVACGLAAALEAPDATVLVHDYTFRPDYQILEEFFVVTRKVETLVECHLKPPLDKRHARTLLRQYLYAPGDQPQTIWAKTRRLLGNAKRTLTSQWR
jgi:hypothetical protein